MAITVGQITGRVLIQFGDSEPQEIGTITVPIEAHASKEND